MSKRSKTTGPESAIVQDVLPLNERLLTVNETCALCNVSRRTLCDWMKRKVIRYRKIGKLVRFVPSEVRECLDRFAQGAKAA